MKHTAEQLELWSHRSAAWTPLTPQLGFTFLEIIPRVPRRRIRAYEIRRAWRRQQFARMHQVVEEASERGVYAASTSASHPPSAN